MGATLKGLGARWGINSVTFTGGIVSGGPTGTPQQFQSLNINQTCDTQEGRNGVGDVVMKAFYNQKKEVTVTVLPTSPTSINAGIDSLDGHMVPCGTTINFVDGEGGTLTGVWGGAFNCIACRQNLSNTAYGMIDLDLETFVANNVTLPIS